MATADISERVARLEAGYEHLATRADVESLHGDLQADMADLRGEMRAAMSNMETRLTRWIATMAVGMVGAVIALGITAIVRLS